MNFDLLKLDILGEEILAGSYKNKIIVTPNVDHIVRLHSDKEFENVYRKADVVVNDSRILKRLASMGLGGLDSLIPGSDLTEWLFSKLDKSTTVTVIGASKETINLVKQRFNVSINHFNPPMGFIDDPAEVKRCEDFCIRYESDLIFFAVGSPRQEILAERIKSLTNKSCLLCVGASILFLSGEERRAPKLLQSLSLEWLFRLSQNPRRLYKRYLVDGIKILPIYIKELFK